VEADERTLRSMYDYDGPRVAQWVYEALLDKESLELDDIPYALDDAVRRLREDGAQPNRWATYMHMGG
jgi:hypothetical protein